MAETRRRVSMLLCALCAMFVTACGPGAEPTAEFSGTIVKSPRAVDATELVGPDGTPFGLASDLQVPLTLVFFGYTNCPDICGQVMQTLATTMTRLSEEDRADVAVIFVTTDPARDTTDVVNEYVARYDPGFLGLTGDLADIVTVGHSLGVSVDRGETLPSGGYDITHGTQIHALEPDGSSSVFWSESVSQSELATDIHTLLAED